ncbi:hypothetical protein [Halioxenophilus sp. WMMB6]|uniref:hypothetical protein n=1 Tax=Halioxenophilus sp. WMMB6 TaxID=3073815 RepID=UPI00295ECDD2|nr:hypothetical protein [Halioxenophilus sp. WMMB6]
MQKTLNANAPHSASSDDQAHLNAFQHYQINAAEFHHRQHLQVAYTLLINYPLAEATLILRAAILVLLNHIGTSPEKYHETLTRAWLVAVNHFMASTPSCQSFAQFINANPQLLDQNIIYQHYSPELIQSAQARTTFVEPDIGGFPDTKHRPG